MSEETFEQQVARQLSWAQKEFLVEHFNDGRRLLIRADVSANEGRTRVALLTRELVRLHPPTSVTARPTYTVLTEKGHAVMCAALGQMADTLTHAELAQQELEMRPTVRKIVHGYGYKISRSPARDDPRNVQHTARSRD